MHTKNIGTHNVSKSIYNLIVIIYIIKQNSININSYKIKK